MMRIEQMEEENIVKLLEECGKKEIELHELMKQTPSIMWQKELKEIHSKYKQYQLDRRERQKGSGKKIVKRKKKAKIKKK